MTISSYERYGKENEIDKDLEFMTQFYKEEERQKELKKESDFLMHLWNIAFPCCKNGESMAKRCSSQIAVLVTASIASLSGPCISRFTTSKYSASWLYKFIRFVFSRIKKKSAINRRAPLPSSLAAVSALRRGSRTTSSMRSAQGGGGVPWSKLVRIEEWQDELGKVDVSPTSIPCSGSAPGPRRRPRQRHRRGTRGRARARPMRLASDRR